MSESFRLSDIHVRVPSDEEFTELTQFSFDNFVEETSRSTGESPEDLRRKFGGPVKHRSENSVWLSVEHNSKRVGFVWFQINPQLKEAFGWDIYLDMAYRSKGIGRHLMFHCKEELLKKEIKSVKICVFEHNEIARRLYESLGFTVESFDEERKQFTLFWSLSNAE